MKQKCLNWYRRLVQSEMPDFRNLTPLHMPSRFLNEYNSPIFFTPRYQKIPYSEQFLKYLRYMQRRNSVSYQDMRVFVEQLLS
jgi:hypothetical protein